MTNPLRRLEPPPAVQAKTVPPRSKAKFPGPAGVISASNKTSGLNNKGNVHIRKVLFYRLKLGMFFEQNTLERDKGQKMFMWHFVDPHTPFPRVHECYILIEQPLRENLK